MSRVIRNHPFRITPVDKSAVRIYKSVEINPTDATTHMETFLRSFTSYTSEDGIPSVLHVYIADGKKPYTKKNKDNVIFEVDLPDIPVAYDPESPSSMKKFIASAYSPKDMREKVERLSEKTVNDRTDYNARTMLNYLKHELAFRYLIAQDKKDTRTMQVISDLDVMKDFDFDVFNVIRRFNLSTLNDEDVEKLLSAQQNKQKQAYIKNYVRYLKTRKKYEAMFDFLNDYQKQSAENPNKKVEASAPPESAGPGNGE